MTNKYKPYLTYKPSDVEWLGEVPAHWEVRRLKYSAPFANGKLDNKPEYATYVGLENIEPWTGELLLDYQPDSVDSTVVTFGPGDAGRLQSPSIQWNMPPTRPSRESGNPQFQPWSPAITERTARIEQLCNRPAGDVLFGKLRPYLAKVARPDFEGTATSEVLVMRPLDECSQSYLAYCLLNAPYIRWIDTLTYGAKMPRVSPDEVACSFIPLPPLPEQQAIAAFLDRETARIDALVSKKERLIELLQEKRTALITRAVTRGLDPNAPLKDSGVEWLGELPAHWEVKRLKYLATLNDEALPETTDPDMEITYVDIGNVDSVEGITGVQDLVFEDAPSRARRIVRQGDVIISTVRTYLKAIARIEPTDANLIVSTGFAVIRPRKLDDGCVAYALSSPYFVDRVVAHSVGVSYPAINASELACLDIAFPPLPEQQAIASFLDQETAKLDGLVGKVQEAIERLRELRTALISAAVTGRIDVRGEAA